jgi:hypothetical protein
MGIADDPASQGVAVFGGLGRGLFDDTWTWDGTDWTHRKGHSPTPRYGEGMTFETTDDLVVLFGGWDGSREVFGDTWTWDGTDWTQRPAGSIRLDVRSGPPGTPVQVEAWGFASGELVKITFVDASRGRTLLKKVKADATGAFTVEITIPPNATAGRQRVKAKAPARADVVKRGFTVIG